jgi:protein-tyrosine kinase
VDKIQEAISQARKQRDGSAVTTRNPEATRSVSAGEDLEQDDVSSISYTRTRVVTLDDDHLESHRIIAHNKDDPRSGAFDLLRTMVVRKMKDHNWQTLAVTSPTAACGKTVVSINLSISLAHQTDSTVLLADFDLRRPKIATYLGIDVGTPLISCIEGKADLSEVLVNPGLPRLVVAGNRGSTTNASELLTGKKTKHLVDDLKTRYKSRFVVFDLPPLLATDDAIAFLPEVDCVLLVAASGHSTKSDIEESFRLLNSACLIGSVLNKSDEANKKYSYDYST